MLKEIQLSVYSGAFYSIYQMNQIIGNLISSFVFEDGFPALSAGNESTDTSICGVNYCTEGGTECKENNIDQSTGYLLVGIYTGVRIS